MDVSTPRKIVLLGKTGSGKSSSGNTILGLKEEYFPIGHSAASETSSCQQQTMMINEKKITVLDSPGLFDTNIPEKVTWNLIIECAPEIHAFLIVLRVENYTVQEEELIAEIDKMIGKEAFKHAIILFTHGDQLEEGKTIQEFVKTNKNLNELVVKCGGRCHVIDNKYWNVDQQDQYRSNKYQVTELLNTIETMVQENGGGYTNELLQPLHRGIQAEEEKIRNDSSGQMTEEEISQEAKKRLLNTLIKVTGLSTGVLLGALLGVAVPLAIVLAVIIGHLKGADAVVAAATGGGVSVWVVAGTAAVAGGIRGGMVGVKAANDAEKPLEAAEKATKAVLNDAKEILAKVKSMSRELNEFFSQPKGYSKLSNENDSL